MLGDWGASIASSSAICVASCVPGDQDAANASSDTLRASRLVACVFLQQRYVSEQVCLMELSQSCSCIASTSSIRSSAAAENVWLTCLMLCLLALTCAGSGAAGRQGGGHRSRAQPHARPQACLQALPVQGEGEGHCAGHPTQFDVQRCSKRAGHCRVSAGCWGKGYCSKHGGHCLCQPPSPGTYVNCYRRQHALSPFSNRLNPCQHHY